MDGAMATRSERFWKWLHAAGERLGAWKAVALIGGCVALLWLLHPPRQLGTAVDESDVVEIVYMGPGGPIQGAMADVVREFERRSREEHERDPSKPIYRVVSGQSAGRNQVDPACIQRT